MERDGLCIQAGGDPVKRIVIGRSVVEWVAKKTQEAGDFGSSVGIGLDHDGELVAGVAYCQFNGPNIVCHIASDGSKRWLTRDFLWTIFDYPFNQAKVERITVCIGQGNKDSIKFVEHLGFEFETYLKDAHPTGNLLIFVMRRTQCRFIMDRYAKRCLQKNGRASQKFKREARKSPDREIHAHA